MSLAETPERNYKEKDGLDIRKKQIIELTKKPILSPQCIGYQGTSLEAIKYLLDFGNIPGCTDPGNANDLDLPQLGDIYFAPTRNFPKNVFDSESMATYGTRQALSSSIGIAERVAQGHHLCLVLSLPIEDHGVNAQLLATSYSSAPNYKHYIDIFNRLGFSNEKLQNAISETKQRKGFLVGVGLQAMSQYNISPGDGADDFRIETGNQGLDINYLTVIRPLGPIEKKFIKNLNINL